MKVPGLSLLLYDIIDCQKYRRIEIVLLTSTVIRALLYQYAHCQEEFTNKNESPRTFILAFWKRIILIQFQNHHTKDR